MTDEFQKGLITGLAMQPLQVTTEHAEGTPAGESKGGVISGPWLVVFGVSTVIGEVLTVKLGTEAS